MPDAPGGIKDHNISDAEYRLLCSVVRAFSIDTGDMEIGLIIRAFAGAAVVILLNAGFPTWVFYAGKLVLTEGSDLVKNMSFIILLNIIFQTYS